MLDAINGQDTMRVSEDVAVGVVMAIPDFPYSRLTKKETSGYPVYGWDKVPARNFHPAEMMAGEVWEEEGGKLVKCPGMVTSGAYVCVVSGNGSSVREAQERAYKNLKRVELPNSPMYRTDIGDRLEADLKGLKEHGFCTGWKW